MRLRLYNLLVIVLLLASCANRGVGPQGGPKDSIPPVPLECTPVMGALEFKGKKIEVVFNEYIQLDNVAQNLLMSPPQQNPPDVKARGKKLIVLLQDTLKDSTTYTIDFGDAVCDYREKIPLHGYSFYFSTGPEIDTLETRGRVYDASNLNPLDGIIVGIHSNLEDSAFTTEPFARIARTDTAGCFRVGNIHPGTYRLYALEEMSKDYRFSAGEGLAFADEVIMVSELTDEGMNELDSIPADSIAVDSVQPEPVYPQTNLFLFYEEQQKLYLQRTLREKQHQIQFIFSSAPDSLPDLRPLTDSLHYVTRYSMHNDTITWWLLDSASIGIDSLFIEARYRRTDSLYRLGWHSDTLRAIWRAPRLSAKAREALDRQNRNRRLDLKTNARNNFDIYDTLRITCSTPLATIERDLMHLFEKIDSIYKQIPFTLLPYDTFPMNLQIAAVLEAGKKYELRLDSAALHDIYGISHIAGTYALQLKTPADYSTLRVKLTPECPPQARIQLMNKSDEVVRELPAAVDGALFEYLKPDTYYIRMYLDLNGDGKWTTGSWAEKRQPEPVYYFPQKVQTKSNWDFEEEWDYTLIPQTKAKPAELRKASADKKKK